MENQEEKELDVTNASSLKITECSNKSKYSDNITIPNNSLDILHNSYKYAFESIEKSIVYIKELVSQVFSVCSNKVAKQYGENLRTSIDTRYNDYLDKSFLIIDNEICNENINQCLRTRRFVDASLVDKKGVDGDSELLNESKDVEEYIKKSAIIKINKDESLCQYRENIKSVLQTFLNIYVEKKRCFNEQLTLAFICNSVTNKGVDNKNGKCLCLGYCIPLVICSKNRILKKEYKSINKKSVEKEIDRYKKFVLHNIEMDIKDSSFHNGGIPYVQRLLESDLSKLYEANISKVYFQRSEETEKITDEQGKKDYLAEFKRECTEECEDHYIFFKSKEEIEREYEHGGLKGRKEDNDGRNRNQILIVPVCQWKYGYVSFTYYNDDRSKTLIEDDADTINLIKKVTKIIEYICKIEIINAEYKGDLALKKESLFERVEGGEKKLAEERCEKVK